MIGDAGDRAENREGYLLATLDIEGCENLTLE